MIKYKYPGCGHTIMVEELPHKGKQNSQRKICIHCRNKIDAEKRKKYNQRRKELHPR